MLLPLWELTVLLSTSISEKADTKGLTEAYGHFKQEAEEIAPNYEVKTINTDGWSATVAAWQNLYQNVVPVRCFLHAFIKIRSCAKKHPLFHQYFGHFGLWWLSSIHLFILNKN